MVNCCPKYSRKDLREPVEFTREVQADDGAGGHTLTHAAVADAPTRGMVVPLSGSEKFRLDRIEAHSSFKLVTRYSGVIAESDTVEIRGRKHNVRHIRNVDFVNEWLEIMLDLGVAI
ncbi:MAG: phage head closure protein [Pikeienuella sp.]